MSKKYNLSPSEKLNYVQEARDKRAKFKKLRQVIFALVILAALFLIAGPYINNYHKKQELEKEIARAKNKIEQYEKSNEELREFLDYLSSDQAIEERARLDFGLQKKGEKVVVIQKGSLRGANLDDFSEDPEPEVPNPRKWVNYFFNINLEINEQ
jgi:cell division protein FtsB